MDVIVVEEAGGWEPSAEGLYGNEAGVVTNRHGRHPSKFAC